MDNLESVFARNCSVSRIEKTAAAEFLNKYHRLGDTTCRYRYGLFVKRSTGEAESSLPEGTLVAVAAFSNARRWQKADKTVRSYEWVRYSSIEGIRVTGGMGKLLNAFVEDVKPDDIMSYADVSSEDGGDAYRQLGFELEGKVERENYTNLKFRKKFTY